MGFRSPSLFALVALALAATAPAPIARAQPMPPLSVFAAASLKGSFDEVAQAYEGETGQAVRATYAASPALARQIDQGAPADVFVSADLDWMDWLQARDLLAPDSRASLLRNALVLVGPAAAAATPFALERDLVAQLGRDGRLAMALTTSVPAGKYGRAALVSLELWDAVAARVVEAENVRAALLLVARGEAPLGIVYRTDALAEPRVVVLAEFPPGSHPEIVYPVARLRGSRHPGAAGFVRWLQAAPARAIFARHGFLAP